MADHTAAADGQTFTGKFDLRNWEEPCRVETSTGVIAWELCGMLVSCQEAVLTLDVGKPERVLVVGGVTRLLTPVQGDLRIDRTSFPVSSYLAPGKPDQATGHLEMRQHGRTLGFNLQLRRNRLTTTLFARTGKDEPIEMQVLKFYRVGEKGPPRRAPEKAPPPIVLQKPPVAPSEPPPTRPQTDPAAQLAAEWTSRLKNTQLSHAENDSQTGYGGSTYYERRTVLQLFDGRFVLDRSTVTRVSYAGLTSPSSSRTQVTGTWTILAVAGASRVRLQLTSTDGEQMVYVLGAGGSDSLLVDGVRWRWGRVA